MSYPNLKISTSKLPKGQIRCFHCRKISPCKDGRWLKWENMQVFMCKTCELSTELRPERKEPEKTGSALF